MKKRVRYTYIPNSEIESLTTWNGKEFKGSQLLDGAYARGNVKYNKGGILDKRRGELNSYSDERIARIYSDLKELDYSDVIIEIKGNKRERQDAINQIMKEVEKREMADGGMMAKGGMTKIEEGDEIEFVFKVPTILDVYESDDTELMQPIEEIYNPSEKITADVFGVDENKIDIQFGDGSVAFVMLKDIVLVSINGEDYFEKQIKYGLGGKMMAKGGYASRHRKLTLEEKAQEMYGASWFYLDDKTRAYLISEMVTDKEITKGAKGLVVGKYSVTFTLANGKNVKKNYESKEKMEDGISDMYLEYDVVDVSINEPTETTESKEEKKGIFQIAKVTEKQPKGKEAKQRKGVEVEGIESDIARYEELKRIMKNAKAEQELIGGRIKELGKDKYLQLYEETGVNPNSIDLVDGDEKIMLQVKDGYKKVEPEKKVLLQENYPDLIETTIVFTLNPTLLDKYGEVLTKLIQNSKEISEDDKENLIKGESTTVIKKGSIDKLMNYDNPAEVFNLIEPTIALM